MAGDKKAGNRTIAENRKAFHDYFIEESLEAGIELCGTEVKSLRAGGANLKDAWCSVVKGEMVINGMHISPYEHGNIFNRDPLRVRRLLLHKREILRLYGSGHDTRNLLLKVTDPQLLEATGGIVQGM